MKAHLVQLKTVFLSDLHKFNIIRNLDMSLKFKVTLHLKRYSLNLYLTSNVFLAVKFSPFPTLFLAA